MKLKIESTETGEVFNMRMENSIDKLKFQVSLLIPIPPHDQIMLIGPPYKILDSLYGPALNVEGKRIFVFNRRILSDESKEPQRIKLAPYEVPSPDLNNDMMEGVDVDQMKSAVMEFESYFQQQLKKSQCIETFVQESYKSCRTCVAQHQVQLDGIGAAISNLQFFHHSISKAYMQCESKLTAQQSEHATLLDSFEASLQSLAQVPLHPAIKAAFAEYTASALNASSAAQGREGGARERDSSRDGGTPVPNLAQAQTLYDCVPVDRERVYLAQCVSNHKKVDENLRRVHSLYEEVQAGVRELTLPQVDFDSLQHHLDSIAQENAAQAEIMRRFRRDYQFVYDHITHCTSPSRNRENDRDRQLSGDNALADDASTSTAPYPANPTTANPATNLNVANPSYISGTDSPDTHLSTNTRDSVSISTRDGSTRDGSYRDSGRESFSMGGAGGPIDTLFDPTTNPAGAASNATAAVHPSDDVERVLIDLQRRKNSQEGGHYLELMEFRVKRVRECKNEIERSQNWLLRSIYRLMRQIALLQTDIQYKLKRDVDWMKKLISGHNEYFLHLQNITKLPFIYHHTLNEIVRRRSYNALFEGEIVSASEKISGFRTQETHQRELFMQLYGLHLPPIFFRAIPTLKEKPPYFSPTLTDPQWLPEIQYEDVDRTYLSQEYTGGAGVGGGSSGGSGGSGGGSGGAGFGRSVSFSDLAEGSGKHNSTNTGAGGDGDTVVTEQSEVGMNVQSEYKEEGGNSTMSGITNNAASNLSTKSSNTGGGNTGAGGAAGGASTNTTGTSALVDMAMRQFPPDYKRPAVTGTNTGTGLTIDIATTPTHTTSNMTANTTHNANLGGSVILRAAPAVDTGSSDAYNALLQRCARMEYENSQLQFKVAEMGRQLQGMQAQAQGHKTAPSATSVDAGTATSPPTPTATTPTNAANTSTNTTSTTTNAATAAAVTSAAAGTNTTTVDTANNTTNTSQVTTSEVHTNTTPVNTTDTTTNTTNTTTPINATATTATTPGNTSTKSSSSTEELNTKLSNVGVLNKLLHGYTDLHTILTSDSLIQAYLAELHAHNSIPPTTNTIYTTDETFIAADGSIRSIRDTTQATLQATQAVLHALVTQLRYPKITFMDFKAGDVALFMPVVTENRKIWMAFHASTPYRYLAEDSLVSFQARSKNKEQRAHIMGRIFLIDTKVASLEENPYNLAIGTEYFICFVEALKIYNKGRTSSATTSNTTSTPTTTANTTSNAGTYTTFTSSKTSAREAMEAGTPVVGGVGGAGGVEGVSRSDSNTNLSLVNPNATTDTPTKANTTSNVNSDW